MLKLNDLMRPRYEVSGKQPLARLLLTGFMGAGKSTVGPRLAAMLGWRFLDLDRLIEAECAQPIHEIFDQHGEAYFRFREREAAERLKGIGRVVVALGGGTLEDARTLSSIQNSSGTCMVFLDAPLPELLARLGGSGATRPLLQAPNELALRFERRLPQYRAAHLIMATTGLSPQEVSARILERLRQEWNVD